MAQSNMNEQHGRGYRLRTVILLTPFIALLAGFFLALRTGLAGGGAALIESDFILGALLVLVVAIIGGGLYVLVKPRDTTQLHVSWRTVLATALLGMVLVAVLYPRLNADQLRWLVPSLTDDILGIPARLAVLGAVDGLMYGAVQGAVISVLDPAATYFTRRGILRYSIMFTLVCVVFVITAFINESGDLGDRFSGLIGVLLLGAVKLGVNWRDKRAKKPG